MIKRGTLVTWHKSKSARKTEELEGKCYGVIRRAGRPTMALVMLDGYSKINELELSQLEERKANSNE